MTNDPHSPGNDPRTSKPPDSDSECSTGPNPTVLAAAMLAELQQRTMQLPDNLFGMPTRAELRAMLTKQLAGPYPGPNKVAIAAMLADHCIRLRDEQVAAGQLPPLRGEEPRYTDRESHDCGCITQWDTDRDLFCYEYACPEHRRYDSPVTWR